MSWLTQPGVGTTGWGSAVNTNFDLLEQALKNGASIGPLTLAENIDMGGCFINNLADPVADQDAATKKWVGDNYGTGDVTGPGTSMDTALARFNGTSGDELLNSGITVDGSNNMDMGGGAISNVGNVDGRDLSADGSKLDGIEALADVTDDSNVDAAGATMNLDTDVSGNSWVLDQDDMSSDDDHKVPTQQSVKAYVDNSVPALGGWSSKSVGTSYEAETDGFIVVNPAATGYYAIYVENSDPATEIRTRGQAYASYGSGAGACCPVQSGYYWRVKKTYGDDPTAIWWVPFS